MIALLKKIKKLLLFVLFVWILIKLFQIGFNSDEELVNSNDIVEKVSYKEFDYGDYKNVRLLHIDTR